MPEDKKKKDMGGPEEQTVNNPVAIAGRDGTVHLLYCVEYMRCYYLRSEDDGLTWSAPVEFTSTFDRLRPQLDWQVIATGPGHAVQLTTGRLVVPFWMTTYESGHPHLPKKNGRRWAYSFLTVARFNLEWMMSGNDAATPVRADDERP